MSDDLVKLLNVPKSISLGGVTYKISVPTLKDLGEAQAYANDLKKAKRAEQLKERLEFFQKLPKDINPQDKKELLETFFPKELTAVEKLNLMASFPDTLTETQKLRRLAIVSVEKDNDSWSETLFLLHKCLVKHNPEVTVDQISSLVNVNELKSILEVLNPSEADEKNV